MRSFGEVSRSCAPPLGSQGTIDDERIGRGLNPLRERQRRACSIASRSWRTVTSLFFASKPQANGAPDQPTPRRFRCTHRANRFGHTLLCNRAAPPTIILICSVFRPLGRPRWSSSSPASSWSVSAERPTSAPAFSSRGNESLRGNIDAQDRSPRSHRPQASPPPGSCRCREDRACTVPSTT